MAAVGINQSSSWRSSLLQRCNNDFETAKVPQDSQDGSMCLLELACERLQAHEQELEKLQARVLKDSDRHHLENFHRSSVAFWLSEVERRQRERIGMLL